MPHEVGGTRRTTEPGACRTTAAAYNHAPTTPHGLRKTRHRLLKPGTGIHMSASTGDGWQQHVHPTRRLLPFARTTNDHAGRLGRVFRRRPRPADLQRGCVGVVEKRCLHKVIRENRICLNPSCGFCPGQDAVHTNAPDATLFTLCSAPLT